MNKLIVRIDDVSPNTDMDDLAKQLDLWIGIGNVAFIVGINVISRSNETFSVYPSPPFKKNERPFFYDVDQIKLPDLARLPLASDEIASHGLVHVDHSLLSYDAQELSILTSCNLLSSSKFIPPFNMFNPDTEAICGKYGIEIIRNTDDVKWRSLETHSFDPSYSHWYYHPFRINADSLKDRLVQGDTLPVA